MDNIFSNISTNAYTDKKIQHFEALCFFPTIYKKQRLHHHRKLSNLLSKIRRKSVIYYFSKFKTKIYTKIYMILLIQQISLMKEYFWDHILLQFNTIVTRHTPSCLLSELRKIHCIYYENTQLSFRLEMWDPFRVKQYDSQNWGVNGKRKIVVILTNYGLPSITCLISRLSDFYHAKVK